MATAAVDPTAALRCFAVRAAETAQGAAGSFSARRSAPSVMRPSTMNSAKTTSADAPSAQFLAMPKGFNVAGPAPVIRPRIAAAHANALTKLIDEKSTAGIDD